MMDPTIDAAQSYTSSDVTCPMFHEVLARVERVL